MQTTDGVLVAENQAGHGVQYVTLETFLQNATIGEISVKKFAGTETAREQIIPHINALLGRPYNLVNFNCEHFAEYIQNGRPESQQVGAFVLGALAIWIGYLAFGGKGRK